MRRTVFMNSLYGLRRRPAWLDDATRRLRGSGAMPPLAGRLAFVATLALVAVILTIAAHSPGDVPARLGQRLELVELIAAEQSRVAALRSEVDALTVQVASYEESRPDDVTAALQAEIDALAPHAGMRPLAGRGIAVILNDSPLQTSPSGDLNDLVVHEEDLQAVINALWAGGAEAISVQGRRILSTTAIRCVGNTLLLHGEVHSPPYRVEAIGHPELLRAGLDEDPNVAWLRARAEEFQLGLALADEDLTLPGFDGATGLHVAQPSDARNR